MIRSSFLFATLLCFVPGAARATPPLVVAGSTASVTGSGTSLTLSSVLVDSTPDRALVVCLTAKSSGVRAATSVTWGGQALAKVASSSHLQSSGFIGAEAWVLANPTPGTGNVVATLDSSASVSLAALVVGGTSGQGRNVTRPSIPPAPLGYSYGSLLTLGDAGDEALLLDCAGVGNNFAATPTAAGQVARVTQIGAEHRLQVSDRAGPGGLGWQVTSDSTRWGHVLLEWLPAGAAPPGGGGMCDCTSESFTPPDAMTNVTAAPYGAACDGTADDTGALLSAIRRHGTGVLVRNSMKIPNRTCKVSDTLVFRRPVSECAETAANCWIANAGLFGSGPQSRIRLPDAQDGFGTSVFPRALVYMASLVEGGANGDPSSRRADGSGAKAFQNQLWDLTISTGSGNPGAIGVDFIVNNFGGIRRTTIRSEDGRGVTGIQATRYGPGPGLWAHVAIAGFDRCIDLGAFDYGMTAEYIDCEYGVTGIRLTSNTLSARKVLMRGAGPAVQLVNSNATLALIDSTLTCTANCAGYAIIGSGRVFLRNVKCPGFVGGCMPGAGGTVVEYSTHGPYSAFAADERKSLNLPIKDAPRAANPKSHALRVSCNTFGAGGNGDATPALQAAVNVGKPVVYCSSHVGYRMSGPVSIPATTLVLDGLGANIKGLSGSAPSAIFVVAENSEKPLHIRRWWGSELATGTPMVHRPAGVTRTVVVEDVAGRAYRFDGPGDVFLSDVAGLLDARAGAHVWARQLDLEENDLYIKNDGARVWVLGIKTERANQVSRTINGGCTEILGGLTYVTEAPPAGRTAHEVIDASAFVFHAETSYVSGNRYDPKIRETRGGVTQELLHAALPGRGLGSVTFGSAHERPCGA